MSLLDEFDRAVSALRTEPADAAAVAYGRLLAAELDRAESIERAATRAVERARVEHGRDSFVYEEVTQLRAQLGRRSALVAIGKTFHALLTELRATPKGRPEPARVPDADQPASKLALVREST